MKPSKWYQLAADYGLRNSTNLFWYYREDKGINFGDWIGPYIYSKRREVLPTCYQPSKGLNATCFFTAGSILSHIKRKNTAIVWGSGAIRVDSNFPSPKRILAVRGPLTQEVCHRQGYECPAIYGDPAILLPSLYRPTNVTTEYSLGIVPHYMDYNWTIQTFGTKGDFLIIDVRQPVECVIGQILKCENIVSSSLHGLVVSHSYGIPAAWIELSDNVIGNGFKFRDYFSAGGIDVPLSPFFVADSIRTEDLKGLVRDAPVPNNSSLTAGLLSTCPF